MANISMMGITHCKTFGTSTIKVSNFGVPVWITEFAQNFDYADFTLPAGTLRLILPLEDSEISFETLAAYPSNKALDIMIFLTLPPWARKTASTLRAEPLPRPETDEEKTTLAEQIIRKNNIMAVFLLSYLLYGTPRTVELRPPAIERGILAAAGLVPDDMVLDRISSVANLKGFRQPELVNQAISIFQQASPAMQARVRRSFGGNRMFSVARVMRLELHKTNLCKMVSEHREVEFFMDPKHDAQAPYVTFHPDHPTNPMQGHYQRVLFELGKAFQQAGGDVEVLAREAPHVVLRSMVDAWTMPQRSSAGSLPELVALKAASAEEFSIKLNVV
ncbi:hypothetical protein BGZ52_009361 [Haplosporangium bisporale]|nr:hypothetical protein BGZ52_009361 [Haplosporangium bisporale]KAF9215251.1 hypothetical protein BGZ59_001898 [Podila verticillata]KFH64492.1 hypothetical protein MVEG_09226 [Podila verticillata NRRL 6337]